MFHYLWKNKAYVEKEAIKKWVGVILSDTVITFIRDDTQT